MYYWHSAPMPSSNGVFLEDDVNRSHSPTWKWLAPLLARQIGVLTGTAILSLG